MTILRMSIRHFLEYFHHPSKLRRNINGIKKTLITSCVMGFASIMINGMRLPPRSKALIFTHHAHAKMQFYKLSESRVRHVMHAPKRIEEGVALKTVAMMQPGSIKRSGPQGGQKETWSQEIWIMFQDIPEGRRVISAW